MQECGGNLFDAVSLAVKAALYSTVIPKVSVTLVDGGEPELSVSILITHQLFLLVKLKSDFPPKKIQLSDDPFDGTKLRVSQCPVLLTLARIGNYCVVDPTPEEESCTAASLVVGVTPDGRITTMRKMGAGSFHQHTLGEALKLGKNFTLKYVCILKIAFFHVFFSSRCRGGSRCSQTVGKLPQKIG